MPVLYLFYCVPKKPVLCCENFMKVGQDFLTPSKVCFLSYLVNTALLLKWMPEKNSEDHFKRCSCFLKFFLSFHIASWLQFGQVISLRCVAKSLCYHQTPCIMNTIPIPISDSWLKKEYKIVYGKRDWGKVLLWTLCWKSFILKLLLYIWILSLFACTFFYLSGKVYFFSRFIS